MWWLKTMRISGPPSESMLVSKVGIRLLEPYWSEWPALPPRATMVSWDWAVVKGHVWVWGPTAARRGCANVCGPWNYWRAYRCQWSVMPPEALLISKGVATSGDILIWIEWPELSVSWCWHPAWAAAEGHVWVCSLTVARVCIDVWGLCCLWLMLPHGTMEDLTPVTWAWKNCLSGRTIPSHGKLATVPWAWKPEPTIDGAWKTTPQLAFCSNGRSGISRGSPPPPPHHVHGQGDPMTWMMENWF